MAKAAAVMVPVMGPAGEREVRVSSPDRVVFEATDRTPALTKLEICRYFAEVGEPLMRAIGERPTAMERWPDGWREGMRLALGPFDKDADGFAATGGEQRVELVVAAVVALAGVDALIALAVDRDHGARATGAGQAVSPEPGFARAELADHPCPGLAIGGLLEDLRQIAAAARGLGESGRREQQRESDGRGEGQRPGAHG